MTDHLSTVAADPSRVDDLPVEEVVKLLGQVETLRARLFSRLVAVSTTPAEPRGETRANGRPDQLLTAAEAAARLGVSRRWIYRRANSLPFARRLSRGTLRFSEQGLEKWQRSRSRQ